MGSSGNYFLKTGGLLGYGHDGINLKPFWDFMFWDISKSSVLAQIFALIIMIMCTPIEYVD